MGLPASDAAPNTLSHFAVTLVINITFSPSLRFRIRGVASHGVMADEMYHYIAFGGGGGLLQFFFPLSISEVRRDMGYSPCIF